MELVERYLQAVKFWLPRKQQDDIIAELSEDLRAQVEERETALGRPLNEAEIEDLLRRRGSPIRVANGYLPQRSLIGPEVFPIYAFILKIVTVASLVWWCIVPIVGQAMGHVARIDWVHVFAGTIHPLWTGWLFSAAITTLVFAVFERTPITAWIFERWNPRNLPPPRSGNAIPRFNSIVGISGLACLLVFWVWKMTPPLTIHLGNLQIETTPGWSFIFWAVLALSSASFILEITNLLRPWWSMERGVARLLLDLGGLSVFCWSMQAHFVANISWPGARAEQVAFATTHLNLVLAHIFPWAAAVEFIIVAVDIWRMFKIRSKSAHAGWNPVRNPL